MSLPIESKFYSAPLSAKLAKLNFAQKQRLSFIDFSLLFKGSVSRKALTDKFEMGMANATRDLTLYRELAPENIEFDQKERSYIQANTFKPLFHYDAKQTMAKLANKVSDCFGGMLEESFPIVAPNQLNVPDIYIVANIVQAVLKGKAISIIYTSLSSGSAAREIVPHTIVDNGLRWHVRAFDRKSQSFRDFVLTRVTKATLLDDEPLISQTKQEDHQWLRMVPLQLVPHPKNVSQSVAIELDYGMQNGMLELNIRAAMAGYLLRRWNVDCSKNAYLRGGEYHLWLANTQTLYGAENLAIAPGYRE